MSDDKPANFSIRLNEGAETSTLSMGLEGEEPWGHSTMDAQTLDGLIDILVRVRASMKPAIESDRPPKGEWAEGIYDPRWYVQPEPLSDGIALAFRHPGLGWLPFVLPPTSCSDLHQLLSSNLERQKENSQDMKPN